MRRLLVSGLVAALGLAAAPARAQRAHAAKGEACAGAADCADGLYCLRYTCVDQGTFDAAQSKHAEQVRRTYGYAGVALGGGLPTYASRGVIGESANLAFHVGAVLDDVQLELEVSPMTTVMAGLTGNPIGAGEAVATVAYLPRISDMVSWVLRIGGGVGALLCTSCNDVMSAGLTPLGFGEARLDVFGVVIRTSAHWMIEINTPSFRVLFLPANRNVLGGYLMTWVTGFGVHYVF
jgi:hypothetical protein